MKKAVIFLLQFMEALFTLALFTFAFWLFLAITPSQSSAEADVAREVMR